jgi:catechol 2,3-dioxygenase-like lactoylglutathione lyase family enzyme
VQKKTRRAHNIIYPARRCPPSLIALKLSARAFSAFLAARVAKRGASRVAKRGASRVAKRGASRAAPLLPARAAGIMSVPVEAHSVSAAYRATVVAMQDPDLSRYAKVLPAGGAAPATHVLRHHSLALGCTSPPASVAFYAKLGLAEVAGGGGGGGVRRLLAPGGLLVDVVPAAAGAPLPAGAAAALAAAGAGAAQPPANVLMDVAGWKPAGHTHASWSVPSVPAARAFLEAAGIAISGTRSTLAIFARDVDRTTLEFERNDGGDEPGAFTGAGAIGRGKPLDHVGARVRAPLDRHLQFWARTMGFNHVVHRYEPDADPLKNFAPFVTRTDAHCDINFIVNCNTPPPAAGEAAEGVLWEGGVLRPGILWVGYAIAERDAGAALAALRAAGADAVLDTELMAGAEWGGFPAAAAVRAIDGGPTIFLRDLCGNVVRLVPSGGGGGGGGAAS